MVGFEKGENAGGLALCTSSLQIMSLIFGGAPAPTTSSPSSAEDRSSTTLVDMGSHISVLADVGYAMAFHAEAGEELNQISAGFLAFQVLKRSSCRPQRMRKTKSTNHAQIATRPR